MRPLLAALLAAACAACAGGAPARGGSVEGLYRSKCAGCHRAYAPQSHTRAQWAELMPRMARRARLDAEQERALAEWVEANAKDAPGGAR